MKSTSDGSTASYYELPAGCTELQDLISYRNLNAQDGEMFRAIYRKGMASHSDALRDAKKVLFYATAEVKRLEATVKQSLTVPASELFAEKIKAAETAADEGWIKWEGGECPSIEKVDYWMRDGDTDEAGRDGRKLVWHHFDECSDIIAYRIHKDGK
jgi:hypothetical protein